MVLSGSGAEGTASRSLDVRLPRAMMSLVRESEIQSDLGRGEWLDRKVASFPRRPSCVFEEQSASVVVLKYSSDAERAAFQSLGM